VKKADEVATKDSMQRATVEREKVRRFDAPRIGYPLVN
jgi:hypothetical protein